MDNRIKTFFLITLLTALFLFIGYAISGRQGVIIAFVFALLFNFGAYWFSDRIVLAMYRAREVQPGSDDEQEKRLYRNVKEIAVLANLPMPKVFIVPTQTPNAFATGPTPKKSAVAATKGILELLNDDELRGVIAHEMSHIRNRDTLVQTIAATIAGAISYLASMARWGLIFGGYGGNDRDNGGGIFELIILIIVVPIAATIIQFAISRSREFMADESGAKILHSPFGLADALEKLESGVKNHPLKNGNQATSSLFIVNPFKAKSLFKLFSTHPPTEERVNKLRSMTSF